MVCRLNKTQGPGAGVVLSKAILCNNFEINFSMRQVVMSLPAHAGDARDVGSIHERGRSTEKGMATHSSILA